ncbi:hypothetical protein K488DRAFT_67571 [Vararia minispora EC-137]|uniref:Uncharacterized protein n=1 Tax=Vararia minispora EC-137 TaxID=1314806 RepID=A0ACB8QY39_9AGAM|nr:hypothetical protein K488DRAFT_67571 [Vararia minispora EC-137]
MTHLFVSPSLLPQGLAVADAIGLPQDNVLILQGSIPGRRSLDELADLGWSAPAVGLKPKPPKTPEGIPVTLGYAPLYHVLGFCVNIARCFLQPSTVVVIPKWDTELVFKLIECWKVTSMVLVPAYVHMMVHSPSFKRVDFSSLATVACGAAYLPSELRQRFSSRLSIPWWVETFGMSELTGAGLMATPPGLFGGTVDPKPGSTGILIPNFEGRVVREDGSDTDYDEPGELWLRGPAIALGYWRNEQATRETFLPDGWMRTGDRFTMDRQGRFYYIERIKDTLKVSGTQVSPSEIEDKILEHPDALISDVAVAGVEGVRMQDELVPRAWIVLSDKGRTAEADYIATVLDGWVKSQLSRPKWLRGGIEVVDEIPKSPTGKVLRRVLQDRHKTRNFGTVRAKL